MAPQLTIHWSSSEERPPASRPHPSTENHSPCVKGTWGSLPSIATIPGTSLGCLSLRPLPSALLALLPAPSSAPRWCTRAAPAHFASAFSAASLRPRETGPFVIRRPESLVLLPRPQPHSPGPPLVYPPSQVCRPGSSSVLLRAGPPRCSLPPLMDTVALAGHFAVLLPTSV